jgi:hypothetical protein
MEHGRLRPAFDQNLSGEGARATQPQAVFLNFSITLCINSFASVKFFITI